PRPGAAARDADPVRRGARGLDRDHARRPRVAAPGAPMSPAVAFDQIVRALPIGRPPEPVDHDPWRAHALLVREHTTRPGGGALRYAVATLVGGVQVPVWGISGRGVRASEAGRF